MRNFFKKIAASLKEFGSAVKNGDIWVKLSLLIMGMGYFGRKQILKGILMVMLEMGVIASFVS
ncbi:MAG: sugar ABC transporter permease, partial [Pseudobutyrivibrio sp.]|nr:sugar ABC transporter permease [Pseudobutyrivibrio sp.]